MDDFANSQSMRLAKNVHRSINGTFEGGLLVHMARHRRRGMNNGINGYWKHKSWSDIKWHKKNQLQANASVKSPEVMSAILTTSKLEYSEKTFFSASTLAPLAALFTYKCMIAISDKSTHPLTRYPALRSWCTISDPIKPEAPVTSGKCQ